MVNRHESSGPRDERGLENVKNSMKRDAVYTKEREKNGYDNKINELKFN